MPLMSTVRFYLVWVAMGVVGFVIGSILGATNHGLVPAAVPGYVGLVLGDLIFGATFGLTQWLVLRLAFAMKVSSLWVTASSVGFMLGARSGALLTYRLTSDWLPPSVVFGAFMGLSMGLATMIPLSRISAWPRLLGWVAVSVLAWILGESIAFATGFALTTVPLVALAIGGVTGLKLVSIRAKSIMDGRI